MGIYWLRNILFRFIIQVMQRQTIKDNVSCSESLAFVLSGILSGALRKNFAAHDLVVGTFFVYSKDINVYPNNMLAELFAFVSMSYLTDLSRREPWEEVVLISILETLNYYFAYCFIQASAGKSIH